MDLEAGLLAENAKGQGAGKAEGEGKTGQEGTGTQGAEGAKGQDGETPQEKEAAQEEGGGSQGKGKEKKSKKGQGDGGQEAAAPAGKAVEVSREKLNDFDYLVQNFYQVDRTTTVDGSPPWEGHEAAARE